MERCRGLYDAERPRHIGVQDGSTGGIEGGAEVGSALKVSELNFGVHHEEMDEAADDLLILLLVDRGGILKVLEEVHGVGISLGGEGVRAAGCKNIEDRMKHGGSEGASDGVKVESDAEVAVHGGFVDGAGVALVKLEDGLVPEAAAPLSTWVLRIATRRGLSLHLQKNLRGSAR